MGSYRIAVLPGDGIGPEVMAATLQVLDRVERQWPKLKLEYTPHSAGAEHYRQTGCALPQDVVEDCRAADAVLFAAVGLPDVRRPDGTEIQPEIMVGLRRALDLHSAIRPVKLYPGVKSPLRDTDKGIDFVIVRENLEGMFASFGGGTIVDDSVATDTIVITRNGTRRVVETAFRLAERRRGRLSDGRTAVTCVDKANIFRTFAFFRKVFFEVAAEHPHVLAEAAYVDAMSLYMVQNPAHCDVLVMENEFGDILSDLGAGLVGGLGVAPSAEVGETQGLFQPSHGSAPQIAGRNLANPVAMMLSAAMMLDWLGDRRRDADATAAGRGIETAVARVLAEGNCTTPDLGGSAGTDDVARAVVDAL